jgi:RHS repeat-associated protein
VLRFHYHQQALGSVTEITQPSGGVVERVTYDVYGQATIRDRNGAIVSQSAVGSPYLFTGREYDPETGLYHYRARGYDAETGRFLQRDPLGFIDGLSVYEYARTRPSCLVDPLGEDSWDPLTQDLPGEDTEDYRYEVEVMMEDTHVVVAISVLRYVPELWTNTWDGIQGINWSWEVVYRRVFSWMPASRGGPFYRDGVIPSGASNDTHILARRSWRVSRGDLLALLSTVRSWIRTKGFSAMGHNCIHFAYALLKAAGITVPAPKSRYGLYDRVIKVLKRIRDGWGLRPTTPGVDDAEPRDVPWQNPWDGPWSSPWRYSSSLWMGGQSNLRGAGLNGSKADSGASE